MSTNQQYKWCLERMKGMRSEKKSFNNLCWHTQASVLEGFENLAYLRGVASAEGNLEKKEAMTAAAGKLFWYIMEGMENDPCGLGISYAFSEEGTELIVR